MLAALALAGCAGSGDGSVDGPVTVYVSLPLTGPRAVDGNDAADGARLALERADGSAGDLEVRAVFLDDAGGAVWSPAAVGTNARTAAEDSSTAAYIGELDSQPTRASLPITNEAGIAQISPGAGAVDLTRAATGYPESPEQFRSSGEATFARVVPAEDVVLAAAAEWAQQAGAERIAIELPETPFGRFAADSFEAAAADVGVSVVADRDRADLVLEPGITQGFLMRNGEVRRIAPALSPGELGDRGFAAGFEAEFDRAPGPYAAYGYDAMELALEAIESAAGEDDGFRGAVIDAVLEAERPESVLGRYSITADGDTTLCSIQVYEVSGGGLNPRKPICPGG
ncbi:MAG: ABC transporter substrate-binding protein [Solirubrobacterales bacterium]